MITSRLVKTTATFQVVSLSGSTRAPHSQLRVARAEQGKKKKRGLYVLLGTEKKKIEQKTNGGCALMGGS